MPDIGGVDEAKLAQLETRLERYAKLDLGDIRQLIARCQTNAWEESEWLEDKLTEQANGFDEDLGRAVEVAYEEGRREALKDSRPTRTKDSPTEQDDV